MTRCDQTLHLHSNIGNALLVCELEFDHRSKHRCQLSQVPSGLVLFIPQIEYVEWILEAA